MTERREPLRVFVSYAHESQPHKENVRTLARILRKKKMDVFLDHWHTTTRLDWNQTITNRIREADFVLAVVSDRYRAAAEGTCPDGTNLGVQHELTIIRELLNSDRATWVPKIIPVILPGWGIDDVPTVLQPTTASHCRITEVSEQGIEKLLELLTQRPSDGESAMKWRDARSAVRDRIATITSRPAILIPSIAVTAAIAVGIGMMVDFGGVSQSITASGTGNAVSVAPCGQVINGSCEFELKEDVSRLSEAAPTDDELKAELAKEATAEPAAIGPGPWPFMVVDTFANGIDYGLYARTTNQLVGERLGTSANRTLVWADCVAISDFTPKVDSVTDVGPQWLQVRWKPTDPNLRGVSEPSGTERAWMYRGGLVPVQHNGNIPPCE